MFEFNQARSKALKALNGQKSIIGALEERESSLSFDLIELERFLDHLGGLLERISITEKTAAIMGDVAYST